MPKDDVKTDIAVAASPPPIPEKQPESVPEKKPNNPQKSTVKAVADPGVSAVIFLRQTASFVKPEIEAIAIKSLERKAKAKFGQAMLPLSLWQSLKKGGN